MGVLGCQMSGVRLERRPVFKLFVSKKVLTDTASPPPFGVLIVPSIPITSPPPHVVIFLMWRLGGGGGQITPTPSQHGDWRRVV